ncbi:Chromatin modification-related protein EAF1 [Nakaseomyces bracarensis]|uniref:Chromatin modification-related protein EAF1 n=1 Tax=Nakaseomyces bracarensis TaxID=273131 RepID=A0ABR4P0M7_9SACH
MSASSSRSATPTSGAEARREILNQRNKKLSQLYCLSRLNDIINVKQKRDEFVRDLHKFLDDNEVDKKSTDVKPEEGFDKYGLPMLKVQRFRKSLTPLRYGSRDNNTRQEVVRTKDQAVVYVKEVSPYSPSMVWISNKRKHYEERYLDDSARKRRKIGYDTDLARYQVNSFPIKPTPIEKPSMAQNCIRSKLGLDIEDDFPTYDRFNEHSVDAKESMYMIMKDIVPSKIPSGIPLAELRFMAQTLPLISLIPKAHKVLTSDMMNEALNESRVTVVSSRIEELRRSGLWSLRQPKRFVDPYDRDMTHHGVLLREAKWMRDDFVEGRRYKIAVCATLAQAVMDYWNYGKVCCVNVKATSTEEERTGQIMQAETNILEHINDESGDKMDVDEPVKSATDIEHRTLTADGSNEQDDKDDSKAPNEDEENKKTEENVEDTINISELLKRPNPNDEIIPKELPKISEEDYKYYIEQQKPRMFKLSFSDKELSKVESSILAQLPVYYGLDEKTHNFNLDELDMVPISKSLVIPEYENFYKIVEKQLVDEEQNLLQLSRRRGLFYGNRRNHYLRPPSVPSLRYLQNRTPTIWLPEDDQELVKNISAYAYNWDLISAQMTRRPSNSYLSNIERRTPWQCFERFVQLNEKFSFSDLKGPRAHAAQQWLIEAHKFQQRQNRRISPLGVGPESIQRGHRRLRWASVFEAMRKTIKKRENAPRPNPTQPRKMLDSKSMKVPTPAEMSELKAQRDESIKRDLQLRRTAKSRLQLKQYPGANMNAQGSSAMVGQHPVLQQAQGKQPINQPHIPQGNKPSNLQNVASQMTSNIIQQNVSNPIDPNNMNNINNNKVMGNYYDSNNSVKSETMNMQRRIDQKEISEKKILDSYVRKIIRQNPGVAPEIALKAAQSYLKSLKTQQAQRRQKQAKSSPSASIGNPVNTGIDNAPKSMAPASSTNRSGMPINPRQNLTTGNDSQAVNFVDTSNTVEGLSDNSKSTIKSPTPQEILRKYQK